MDSRDKAQIMKASLSVMRKNVIMYSVMEKYMLAFIEETEPFKAEAQKYGVKCSELAISYELMLDTQMFDQYNFPRLKKLMMEQVTKNVHMRQLLYQIKRELTTSKVSKSRKYGCPAVELVRQFPGLLPCQQSESLYVSESELCTVLLNHCNIRKDPVISHIVSVVESLSSWNSGSQGQGPVLNTPYLADLHVDPQTLPTLKPTTQTAAPRPIISKKVKKSKRASRSPKPDAIEILFSDPLYLPRVKVKKNTQKPVPGSGKGLVETSVSSAKQTKTPLSVSTSSNTASKGDNSVSPQCNSQLVQVTKTSSPCTVSDDKPLDRGILWNC